MFKGYLLVAYNLMKQKRLARCPVMIEGTLQAGVKQKNRVPTDAILNPLYVEV